MITSRWLLVVLCHHILMIGAKKKSHHKIYGGTHVAVGEIPYQAVIYFRGELHCGGTIVSEQWIVTAATCLMDRQFVRSFKIGVGNIRLHGRNEVLYNVVQCLRHMKFDGQARKGYDIGFLRTSSITFNDRIKLIKIRVKHEHPLGLPIVSGFGQLQFGNHPVSGVLMKAQLSIYSFRDRVCHRMTAKDQICAINATILSNACQGDVGGPLVVGDKLVGIVSWGHNCGEFQEPVMYTNVAMHTKWIADVMNSD